MIFKKKIKLTMILPSILKSFCSKSQIWIRALLWRNLKIKFWEKNGD